MDVQQCSAAEDWWKSGIFYQIYPRSFKDSNNDGNGDLKGIMEKLPYLKDVGITAVWMSPIMKSPQVDAGYDISNYYDIDEMYGSIEDLKQLIEESHKFGLKLILDFVPNHTSDKHEWFLKSENLEGDFKDYYVWKDSGKDGGPPNNWISVFGGSAWQWSDKRNQYYLHQFLKEQPDLNYRNLKVREEMKKVLKYYLDLGIDGFRVDAVPFLVEDENFRDEPVKSNTTASPTDHEYLQHIYTNNLPETYEIIYDWRKFVDEYTAEYKGETRVLITEAYADLEHTMQYYGSPDGSKLGAHFTFNFFFIMNLNMKVSTADDIVETVETWQNALPHTCISNWVLSNHDNRRIPTRFGVENIDGFNMLLLLLPGVAITYNGDEFGQEDGEVSFEQGRDRSARDKSKFNEVSRDFERTPLQWSDSINAGFNQGAEPWLPVGKKYKEANLASQLDENKLSHFQIYKKIVQIKRTDAVKLGSMNVWAVSKDVVVLRRTAGEQSIVLAFKLGWRSDSMVEDVFIPSLNATTATVMLTSVNSSYEIGSRINPQNFTLKAHESIILEINS